MTKTLFTEQEIKNFTDGDLVGYDNTDGYMNEIRVSICSGEDHFDVNQPEWDNFTCENYGWVMSLEELSESDNDWFLKK